ncbi:hypothetical protein AB0P36_32480 [Streptomyces flavidovirens]|uniref:hypothetical protein n=1 Tax=Streptomyces flavidovirens TaxID=67298 RepID=UPI0034164538
MKEVLQDKGDEIFQELIEKVEELIELPVAFADEPGRCADRPRDVRGRHGSGTLAGRPPRRPVTGER